MIDHRLDGYVVHRALTCDVAEESGELATWPEIVVDVPLDAALVLRKEADRSGLSPEDFLGALVHEFADSLHARV